MKLKLNFIIIFIITLSIIYWFVNYEKYYQTKFCNKLNGRIEYRLEDTTRVDCLTDDYAIEVDWAKKWAEEGIG